MKESLGTVEGIIIEIGKEKEIGIGIGKEIEKEKTLGIEAIVIGTKLSILHLTIIRKGHPHSQEAEVHLQITITNEKNIIIEIEICEIVEICEITGICEIIGI